MPEPITLTRRRFFQALAASAVAAAVPLAVGMPRKWEVDWRDLRKPLTWWDWADVSINRDPLPYWKNA